MTSDKALDIINSNLLPDFKLYIGRHEFKRNEELIELLQ